MVEATPLMGRAGTSHWWHLHAAAVGEGAPGAAFGNGLGPQSSRERAPVARQYTAEENQVEQRRLQVLAAQQREAERLHVLRELEGVRLQLEECVGQQAQAVQQQMGLLELQQYREQLAQREEDTFTYRYLLTVYDKLSIG